MKRHLKYLLPVLPCILLTVGLMGQPRLIEHIKSDYNDIYVYEKDNTLYMKFSDLSSPSGEQSALDLTNPDTLKHPYEKAMLHGLRYTDKRGSALLVGVGGGTAAKFLHAHFPDMKINAVELDPMVLKVAERYFGLKENENLRIYTNDGRRFMEEHPGKYDIIMIDTFGEVGIPYHLMTQEFYKLANENLSNDGILIQNMHRNTPTFSPLLHTITTVFDQVEYDLPETNVILFAYQGEKKTEDFLNQQSQDLEKSFGHKPKLVQTRMSPPHNTGDAPLKDNFANIQAAIAYSMYNSDKENHFWKKGNSDQ